jgi:hypothetical protein
MLQGWILTATTFSTEQAKVREESQMIMWTLKVDYFNNNQSSNQPGDRRNSGFLTSLLKTSLVHHCNLLLWKKNVARMDINCNNIFSSEQSKVHEEKPNDHVDSKGRLLQQQSINQLAQGQKKFRISYKFTKDFTVRHCNLSLWKNVARMDFNCNNIFHRTG